VESISLKERSSQLPTVITPLFTPVGPILANAIHTLSNILGPYSLTSLVVLFILPSLFLLAGVLNFIWATERWILNSLKKADKTETITATVANELLNLSRNLIQNTKKIKETHLDTLSLEQKPTLSFLLWFLSSIIWTIGAAISTIYTDFEEAPGSLLFGVASTAIIVYIWASNRHEMFNSDDEDKSVLLAGFIILLLTLGILFATLQRAS